MSGAPQSEFNFDQSPAGDGLDRWYQQRDRATRRLAQRLGLPIGHEAEVCLKDGVVLRGTLRLKEEMLFIEAVDEHNLQLAVGRVDFPYRQVEACVRLD